MSKSFDSITTNIGWAYLMCSTVIMSCPGASLQDMLSIALLTARLRSSFKSFTQVSLHGVDLELDFQTFQILLLLVFNKLFCN